MSDNRKYYYLKLKENYFDDDSIVLLESMQDGVLYSNILLKLYNHSQKLLSFRYNIDTNRVEARFTDGSAVANRMPNCLRTSSTRYFTVGLTRRIECHRFFMATAENHCNVFCVTNWSSE